MVAVAVTATAVPRTCIWCPPFERQSTGGVREEGRVGFGGGFIAEQREVEVLPGTSGISEIGESR